MRQLLQNQYTLEAKPIGRGTYGKVYFGFDNKNKKKVAIKITPKVHVAKKEVSIMKTYGISQHLPVFYNYFVRDNKAYIIMEAVEGETLGTKNFYYEGKKREQKQTIRMVLSVLKSLQHLHNKGITHNDVLPKNIMIHQDNPSTIKVIDFNLSSYTKDAKKRKKDIYRAALMCIYLINGKVPKNVSSFQMKNRRLTKVINKGLQSGYRSAQEFMSALTPFA